MTKPTPTETAQLLATAEACEGPDLGRLIVGLNALIARAQAVRAYAALGTRGNGLNPLGIEALAYEAKALRIHLREMMEVLDA